MKTHTRGASSATRRHLWMGLGLGPFAWIVALMAGYPLVAHDCDKGILWPAVATAVPALIALWGVLVAWRARREIERDLPHDAVNARRLLMARGGFVLSLLMLIAILAHAAGLAVLDPCW